MQGAGEQSGTALAYGPDRSGTRMPNYGIQGPAPPNVPPCSPAPCPCFPTAGPMPDKKWGGGAVGANIVALVKYPTDVRFETVARLNLCL